MRRKQVSAFLMSGMLVFGTVTPAIAADAETKELMAVEGETEPAPAKTPQAGSSDSGVSGLVTDDMLQSMSENLCALADQVLAAYNAMTEDERNAIELMNSGQPLDIPAKVQDVKDRTTFDALKSLIAGKSPEAADASLTELDEKEISNIDSLNAVIQQAKDYVSNYDQYLQSGITTAIQLLQDLLVKDRRLYAEDYLAQAKKYYDEAVTLKPGVQPKEYIIKFCDEVSLFYQKKDEHLNAKLLDEGIQIAEAFPAFLACAPDPSIANTVFNWGGSVPLTYGNIASHVKNAAEDMKAEGLTYDDMALYATVFYGNLLEAYNGVSSAILSSITTQLEDAVYIGYEGDKKAAYEAALKSYNDTLANKNYAGLADAAKALQKAAEDYAAAAEDYARTEGKKQIEELKKKLYTIKEDIEKYKDYYKDTYLAEVLDAIWMLEEADLTDMSGRQIMELVNSAKEVVDKQSANYSSKLDDAAADAVGLVSAANKWWSFLTVSMRGGAPYIEAIRMTNDLSLALSAVSKINRSSLLTTPVNVSYRNISRSSLSTASNNVHNLDKFIQAYDMFSADLKLPHGKIQSAAKATAQYVYDSAQEVYREEAEKTHTANILQEFRTAIDNLKASIGAWNYDGTRAAAKAVKTAEANLLNDRPAQEGNKNPNDSQTKETDNKIREAASKTGDDADPAGAGMMGLLSMTGIAGILKLRRKNW